MKVAVFNNGLHAEEAFKKPFPKIKMLYVGRTNINRIFLYDILFIPYHLDQVFLYHHRHKLEQFLDHGGVLVLLGATEEGRKWLPFLQWERDFRKITYMNLDSPDARILLNRTTKPGELMFHSSYFAHGSLSGGSSEGDGDVILASDECGGTVMFIKRSGVAGTLFATTLDPDYHCTISVPGPHDEPVVKTHEKAGRLLRNIYTWAIEEAKGKSFTDRKRVRRRAQFRVLCSEVLTIALYSLPVWGFGTSFYLLFGSSQGHTSLAAVGGGGISLLASLGSLASLFSVYQTLKAEKGNK